MFQSDTLMLYMYHFLDLQNSIDNNELENLLSQI